jgi:hypothetical protein
LRSKMVEGARKPRLQQTYEVFAAVAKRTK